MSKPRNLEQSARAEADREAVRRVLSGRTQAEPLLTPEGVLTQLDWPVSRLRSVRRHITEIRAEQSQPAVVPRTTPQDAQDHGLERSPL